MLVGLPLTRRDTRVVDDRELRLRELLRDLRDRVGHQEPDPDHELIAVAHRASRFGT